MFSTPLENFIKFKIVVCKLFRRFGKGFMCLLSNTILEIQAKLLSTVLGVLSSSLAGALVQNESPLKHSRRMLCWMHLCCKKTHRKNKFNKSVLPMFWPWRHGILICLVFHIMNNRKSMTYMRIWWLVTLI